ncbi:hypothetical protein ACX1H4_20095 [Yersinia enterocolitica]|jgi:hypothetical protein|uniref:hypothetical protein n=2 Tax=Yersinia enterocolitica TaxID=630 RepID=UPI001C8E7095|nr:hypothetical protein [Yersinia enterocolitica]EKN4180868.1 hypothetical protein [Yersinia enterocolitica]MBX9485988.1 hypothetical protein [Yersinia enterocolitica]MBX9492171.1 hypothetical protein [Yersinia enterocolitica]
MSYSWLFESPDNEISGDILLDMKNLSPEQKEIVLFLLKKGIDREVSLDKLSDVIKQIEFDVTSVELSAHLFKPGNA